MSDTLYEAQALAGVYESLNTQRSEAGQPLFAFFRRDSALDIDLLTYEVLVAVGVHDGGFPSGYATALRVGREE